MFWKVRKCRNECVGVGEKVKAANMLFMNKQEIENRWKEYLFLILSTNEWR